MTRKIKVEPSLFLELQFTEMELKLLHSFCGKMVDYMAETMEYYQNDPRQVTFSPEFEAKMEKLIREVDVPPWYHFKHFIINKSRLARVRHWKHSVTPKLVFTNRKKKPE